MLSLSEVDYRGTPRRTRRYSIVIVALGPPHQSIELSNTLILCFTMTLCIAVLITISFRWDIYCKGRTRATSSRDEPIIRRIGVRAPCINVQDSTVTAKFVVTPLIFNISSLIWLYSFQCNRCFRNWLLEFVFGNRWNLSVFNIREIIFFKTFLNFKYICQNLVCIWNRNIIFLHHKMWVLG